MQSIVELSPKMLARFTQIDYNREMALIAVVYLSRQETEIGIAHRLMQQFIEAARSHALQIMEGDVLASNREMPNLVAKLGFSIYPSEDETNMEHVVLRL